MISIQKEKLYFLFVEKGNEGEKRWKKNTIPIDTCMRPKENKDRETFQQCGICVIRQMHEPSLGSTWYVA